MGLQVDVLILVLLLGMDYVWLTANKAQYAAMVRTVQGASLSVSIGAAGVAYALMYLAVRHLALPLAEYRCKYMSLPWNSCFPYVAYVSALVGLCVYGIYNATNAAIFKRYSIGVAVMDTAWGCFLFTVVTLVTWYAMHAFGWR